VKERLIRLLNSLTAKYVAVFALLVAVPSLAVAAYTLSSSYDREKQDLVRLQQERAHSLAASVEQSLTTTISRLATIQAAGLPRLRVLDVLRPLLLDPDLDGAAVEHLTAGADRPNG